MREDYYQLLDVEPTADQRELREAYRRMAKRYHPDLNRDNPLAEERFKLVAEAWRTLGNEEKRADYDARLQRRTRYAAMPELERMARRPARTAIHPERGMRRRAARETTAGQRRRIRPFLLRHSSKVTGLQFVIFAFIALSAIVPYLWNQYRILERVTPGDETAAHKLQPGESPLPPEEQQRQLELHRRVIIEAAEKGNAEAQFRYGFMLYMGMCGVEKDAEAARLWWTRAAEQGHLQALKYLRRHAAAK